MTLFGKCQTHLVVQRPSPTTIQYTVSNGPSLDTLVAKAAHALTVATRAVLALAIAYVELALVTESFQNFTDETASAYGGQVHGQLQAFGLVKTKQASWITILCSSIIIWLLSKRSSFEESLRVIQGLGIQTSTSSPSYLSTSTTRFIPTTQIQDIFIHEAFKGFEVKFYLAVIVDGEKEVVVVFPKLMPKLEILEEVWRGSKEVLYQKDKA